MEEFEKLLNAWGNYLSDLEEYRTCVERAGRETDYYCHRDGENLEKAKATLKLAFDSYVKGL